MKLLVPLRRLAARIAGADHREEPVIAGLRRLIVLVVGAGVTLVGMIMLVTPGPGLAVILIGLAALATEFPWAKRLLDRAKREAGDRGRRIGRWWRRLRARDSDWS